jgi:hypothetical protein
MGVIFTRDTPLRFGTGVALKRIFGYETSMAADVDDLVLVDLRRIVHAECPSQLVDIHQRVQSAQQLIQKK